MAGFKETPMDDLERRIREFVHEQLAWQPGDASADIVSDARIYGDDVWELIEEFGKRFNVRLDNFQWYYHSGPEGGGCNPLWLFYRPQCERMAYVPIRLSDLIESACSGVWCVQYPGPEG
jgi:hypothetical protein